MFGETITGTKCPPPEAALMGTQREQSKGSIKYPVLLVHMHDHHALSNRVQTVNQVTEKKRSGGGVVT